MATYQIYDLPIAESRKKKCRVAIIIPHRNRIDDLLLFFDHFSNLNIRDEFDIFIIEQNNAETFNRGLLLNAGYLAANTKHLYDRYIFHDVDSYPNQLMFDNYSQYLERNVHFASPYLGYKYKYSTFLGGVLGMTRNDFERTNGFPNIFFGWGGEDDAFRHRLETNQVDMFRAVKGKYTLAEDKPEGDVGNEANPEKTLTIAYDKNNWTNNGIRQMENPDILEMTADKFFALYSISPDLPDQDKKTHIYYYSVQFHQADFQIPTQIMIKDTNLMKVIYNYEEALQLGRACIEKMGGVGPHHRMRPDPRFPPQLYNKKWKITEKALENTLKYVFEKLHHSCYLLCVEENDMNMYKLENRETAPIFKKILERATGENGHLWKNPTLTKQQKTHIAEFVKRPVRVMQCVVKEFPRKQKYAQSEYMKQNEYLTLLQNHKIPAGVYIFNLTDAIILREDGIEPFVMVTGKKKLGKYDFSTHLPIFSMSGQKGYLDIPMPNYDDIELQDNKSYITDWNQKKYLKAIFRGGPTGCGYTTETNMRLRLVELSYKYRAFYHYVDAEIVLKDKKDINSSSVRFDPKYGLGMLNSTIRLGKSMNMVEQSNFKYIIHIDGNVNAYRLVNTMLTGSLILRVESRYTSWIDHLILKKSINSREHDDDERQCYVSVKSNLSNIIDVIKWCNANEEECVRISRNALRFAKSVCSANFAADYIAEMLRIVVGDASASASPLTPSAQKSLTPVPAALAPKKSLTPPPRLPTPPPAQKKSLTPVPVLEPRLPTPPPPAPAPKLPTPPLKKSSSSSSRKLSSARKSPLPEGMFEKTGKRCPNGSKTHKHKGRDVCKKNVSVKNK